MRLRAVSLSAYVHDDEHEQPEDEGDLMNIAVERCDTSCLVTVSRMTALIQLQRQVNFEISRHESTDF